MKKLAYIFIGAIASSGFYMLILFVDGAEKFSPARLIIFVLMGFFFGFLEARNSGIAR